MGRDADGDITSHIVMKRTKTQEKHLTEGPKSPKKKNSVRYPFYFVEKNYNKKSLEGKFRNKIQTAVSGTEGTIESDTGKIITRLIYFGTIISDQKKEQKRTGTKHIRRNKRKKPTLPTRIGREKRPMK